MVGRVPADPCSCREAPPVVLGKAKVMSFEDIKEARAKRAAKEVIKGKGQRGRKRKSAALEAGEPESDLELELDPQPEQHDKTPQHPQSSPQTSHPNLP